MQKSSVPTPDLKDKSLDVATYHRGYRLRVYPTFLQENLFELYAKAERWVYNEALRLVKFNSELYRKHHIHRPGAKKPYFNKAEFSKQLTEILNLNESDLKLLGLNWLREIPRSILELGLDNLAKAFKAMASGNQYPKFKSYKDGNRFSLQLDDRHMGKLLAWHKGELDFEHKPGKRRILLTKEIDKLTVHFSYKKISFPKEITLTQRPSGKWFLSFQTEVPREHEKITPEMVEAILLESLRLAQENNELLHEGKRLDLASNQTLHLHSSFKKELLRNKNLAGFDLGIKDLLIGSDGSVFNNSKKYYGYQKQLKTQSQNLARKVPGSKNWEKNKKQIAQTHENIANERLNFLHQMTAEIAGSGTEKGKIKAREGKAKNRFLVICLEALKVKNMLKNHKLAKALSDASFGEIVRQLMYKADRQGKLVLQVGTFFPSSKTCFDCGFIYRELKLKERVWVCQQCGTTHERDRNAANNILFEAIKNYAFEQGMDSKLLEALVPDAAKRAIEIKKGQENKAWQDHEAAVAASRIAAGERRKLAMAEGRKKSDAAKREAKEAALAASNMAVAIVNVVNPLSSGSGQIIDQNLESRMLQDVSGKGTVFIKLVEGEGTNSESVSSELLGKQAPALGLISRRSLEPGLQTMDNRCEAIKAND